VSPGVASWYGPADRRQRMGESPTVAGSASQKGPAIGDGCQSREEVVRSISRFAGTLCVAIHTRTGKLFETPLCTKKGADLSPGAVATIIEKPAGLRRRV
jgi:hypothetical protein